MNRGENKISEKDFDQLIKSKMEEGAVEGTPKGWDKLMAELHPDEGQILPFIANPTKPLAGGWGAKKWLSAAAAVAVIAIGAVLLQKENTVSNQIAQQNLPSSNIDPTQNSTTTTPIESTSTFTQASSENLPATVPSEQHHAHAQHTQPQSQATYTNTQVKEEIIKEPAIVEEPFKQTVIAEPATQNTPKTYQQPIELQPFIKEQPYQQQNMHYAKNQAPHTYLGINGGYNFGSLNSGYAVAIKGRTHISNEVFLDGAIGINMNNLPFTAASVPMMNAKARPNMADQKSVNTPAIKNPTQQLLYVAFNPSVGYKVNKRVNVSIGGDVQRIVKDRKRDEVNVIFDPNTNKTALIPQTDLGLTGKTEIQLTKNISAGLLYREGINNLFSNKGNDELHYINRRYVQVQMTYNFPVRL